MKPALIRCLWCGKKMPGSLLTTDGKRYTRSVSISRIDKDGIFCTLRCAAKYGVVAAPRKAQP